MDVVIVAAKRSAIGNFNGSLANVPADEISRQLINDILKESKVSTDDVDEIIAGQVLTAGCGQNPIRKAAVNSGIPKEKAAWTVNQVCGSGLRAISLATDAIKLGNAKIIIAGGHENMSLAPHILNLRKGLKMGDGNVLDSMVHDGLTDTFSYTHMGITAENVADKYNISKKEQDEFAANSQNKAETAQKNGKFEEEITPITIKTRKEEIEFANDEFIRHGVTESSLSKLRPAFKSDGTVTAGNASGINDGAAFVLLMSKEEAEKRGLEILATIKSHAHVGVEPSLMGVGPVSASKKALQLADWDVNDLDLIESNEAFAAQAIAVNKEMAWDLNKVNVNGGAIALGHPIGASGARIIVTLLHEMKRRNAHKGLATLCVGGGMGVAMCFERK